MRDLRYWLSGLLMILLVGAIVMVAWLPEGKEWILYATLCSCICLLLLLFRSVLLPAHTVKHGLDLISAQDFNNRLVKVGEPESDRLVKLFNTMIDKLRNERLRNMERESFLHLLVEASPLGVVMLDFDGNITMANPSFLRITGIASEEEIKGRKVAQLPSDLARRMGEVTLGMSEEIRRGDIRRYRCYHLSFIQSGFQRQFYLLESLTEEVMRAERAAYEKVIRIISHEVNNTMGGVRSVLDTLHDVIDGEEIREVIESCDNRCDQMTRFISSYADVVRVPEPVRIETAVDEMVADMVPFLQGMMPEGVTLSFEPAADGITVELDISLMQQVIVNIVKNAVESIVSRLGGETGRASIAGGEQDGRGQYEGIGDGKKYGNVRMATYLKGEHVVLEISNDGEPISEEVSAHLFSPFFTTKREGRGIGLTLISEILNRHSAVYSLKTGEDGLTRFTIRF